MGTAVAELLARWSQSLGRGVRVALALFLFLPALQVRAQPASASLDAEARALFEAGQVAFEGGRFEAALSRWQQAYKLSSRPALQYNLGLAHDRLRQDEEALAAFRAYLKWDAKGERAEEVQGRIEAIEKSLSERQAEVQRAAAGASADGVGEQVQPVATPTEAAATVALADGGSVPPAVDHGSGDLLQQWWFWPAVGAVAAGALVGGIAAVSFGEEVVEGEGAAIERSTRISALRWGGSP